MSAWHVCAIWYSRCQSTCKNCATESTNFSLSTLSRSSKIVATVGVSPGMDGGRNIGVPIGSARSRSDGIGTVDTGEAAGTGVAAVDRVGLGRGTRDGVLTLRVDGRGASPDPNPESTAGVHYRLLSLFVGASLTTEGLECQERERRTQSNRWSRRSPCPV